MGGVTAVLGLIKLGLSLANRWLAVQDAEKLREAGATRVVAKASLDLLRTLEKANAVDSAVLSGGDSEWLRSLEDKYTRPGADRQPVLPVDHPGHDRTAQD